MTAIIDQPEVVAEEIIEIIRLSITSKPRDLQTVIGPSSIGEPCPRALIAELFNLPMAPEPPNLRAWVGTCVHAELERVFRGERWLNETRVPVGTIGPDRIFGSVDLYDCATCGVWDYKTKSKTQMNNHRRHGPGIKYRVQAHLYGLGMAAFGRKVNYVGFIFIPRDGEFADIFHWAEPYDEALALAAMARANQLHALGTLLGPRGAMEQYPHCDEAFCRVCGNYRRPYGAPRATAHSTRELLAV